MQIVKLAEQIKNLDQDMNEVQLFNEDLIDEYNNLKKKNNYSEIFLLNKKNQKKENDIKILLEHLDQKESEMQQAQMQLLEWQSKFYNLQEQY